METPQTLTRTPEGLRFDDLFQEGLRLVQQHSGRIWTDYNYHDPGVTILEYLVYALMDLSYRTNMPVEDLFFFGADGHDPVRENLLIPPEDIFHTTPHTATDYRRLIIDGVRRVRNVWVEPAQDPSGGHRGLFDILVQSREELGPQEREDLRDEITRLFLRHRNIGCDLGRLVLLEAVPLSVAGTVHIDADAIGEFVLSRIYAELDAYVNPEVSFSNPYDLLREGHPADEVFAGPKAAHGVIRKEELRPKSDSVYVSRMRDIIARIPGVKAVSDLRVFRRGLPVHEDQIAFPADAYPLVEFRHDDGSAAPGIRLLKNHVPVDMDPLTARQLLDFELTSRRSRYLGRIQYRDPLPKGRFTPEQLAAHYAVHNEFPAVYGLGAFSQVQQSGSDERKAQSRQLRAYLVFFEQIIANHLAQLANIRHLLSIGDAGNTTYYTQLPNDVPLLDEVLLHDPAEMARKIDELAHEDADRYGRRNRLLDHLMARFGEHFDADTLRKVARQDPAADREAVEKDIIDAKIRFLRDVMDITTTRNRAFDYREDAGWDTLNVSTLERKLALLLDIRKPGRRSLTRALLEGMGMEPLTAAEDPAWTDDLLTSDTEAQIPIIRPVTANPAHDIRFPRQDVAFIPHLFASIPNPRALRIVASRRENRTRHHVLLRMPDRSAEASLFDHADAGACEQLLQRLRDRIARLDRACEGFHMVEHILLRPLEPQLFTFNILDADGAIYLTGYFPGPLETQSLVAAELPLVGSRPEQFGIVADTAGARFDVILHDTHNQPVARIPRSFPDRPAAQRAITDAAAWLGRILEREIPLGQVLEITAAGNRRLDVPGDFNLSNAVSFILPDWPARFQNQEFRGLFRRLVLENLPAHFEAHVFHLDAVRLADFEDLYGDWLVRKASPQPDLRELDASALRLIQTLGRLKALQPKP